MTIHQLAERVSKLERQVAELQREVRPLRPYPKVQDTFGLFADDPEFDACRALLARGVTGRLRTRHAGAAHDAMQMDIARGACRRIEETSKVGPRFARWSPFPGNAPRGSDVTATNGVYVLPGQRPHEAPAAPDARTAHD